MKLVGNAGAFDVHVQFHDEIRAANRTLNSYRNCSQWLSV
jgi:hypothetical protein